jgi:hypothetical protein
VRLHAPHIGGIALDNWAVNVDVLAIGSPSMVKVFIMLRWNIAQTVILHTFDMRVPSHGTVHFGYGRWTSEAAKLTRMMGSEAVEGFSLGLELGS